MKTKNSGVPDARPALVRNFCTALFALLLLLPASPLQAALRTLPGHVPAAVAGLPPQGVLPAANHLDLSIRLPLRNKAELTDLIQQLYDPASTNFHRYLTPAQFTERFGPTVQDYQSVQDFARSNRLVVESTFGNRALLEVSGSVADIQAAFQVTLRTYRHPTENREFYAPDVEPKVDARLPIVEINGLDNYIVPHPGNHGVRPPGPAPGGGSGPNGDFWGYDFRKAYVPNVSLNGAGQIAGLFELDGYYPSDIAAYESMTGLPNLVPTLIKVGSFNGVPSTNFSSVGEVSLDIESEIAMAPGLAGLWVYEGNYTASILTQMAVDDVAKQISSSWFFGRATTNDTELLEMAAQGQSFFQCSGDNLAYVNGINYGPNSGPPSDDPYLTSVGGTMLTTASDKSWLSETNWNNENGVNGSGGGISTVFTIPIWQQGVNMSANGGSTTHRNIPDVAMVADYCTFVSNNGHTNSWWGTSIAAPLWAGFTALVNQQAVGENKPTVGFLNPALYAIGGGAYYNNYFHDITLGNNTWSSSPNAYYATTGYDLCTGWGSPNGISLINALAGDAGPVYVNFNYNGTPKNGQYNTPYNTLGSGVSAVANYGTIFIETAGSSSETMTITKPMTITSQDVPATVGN